MDISTILIKLTGAILLVFTIRSIIKHIKTVVSERKKGKVDEQSVTEQILNNLLLYIWLAFMVAFSTGMILNN